MFVGSNAFTDTVQVGETGKIYVEKDSSLRPLTQEEASAYENPKIEIPIWDDGIRVKEKFFYRLTIYTSTNSVIYDGESIKYLETEERLRKGNRKFLIYKIIIFLAISLMVAGDVIAKRRNNRFVFFAALVAGIALVTSVNPFGYATISSYLACVSASVAAKTTEKEENAYRMASVAFYVTSTVAFLT